MAKTSFEPQTQSKTEHISKMKRNVKATNPGTGPLPTVFPLDGHKLQNRLLGD